MEDNLNQQVLDKLTKTCVCKVVTRAKIKESIKAGAKTVDDVKLATGAGTGSCKGCRCVYKIQELIESHYSNR